MQMIRLLAGFFAIALISMPAQAAMNWCALTQIVPEKESDFERIAPTVEALTGCKRQPSDSAHVSKWICDDDPATADVVEAVHLTLHRLPSEGIHLIAVTFGMESLDKLRVCPQADLRNRTRFDAGNVLLRDQATIGIVGPRLALTNSGPDSISFIISDRYGLGANTESVRGVWEGAHGITTVAYPATSIELAGKSPISTDAYSLIEAYESRGAKITLSEDINDTIPKWTLSPPIGLAGVDKVEVTGFVRHVLRVKYVLSTTADYERFIGLLDAQYGQSKRSSENGCTWRWWVSGNASINGKHCPDGENALTFFNDVAQDQLDQYLVKLNEDEKKRSNSDKKATIDSDMF
jgi:hypothetical protein